MTVSKLEVLKELERKVLWLSAWMIHNANHLRENRDGLKTGGHQASCASAATIMTALYFAVLRAEDRVAVKPHAGPVFHAIQYLLGRQTREKLEKFRGYGGAQSYPSRTKDSDGVDFSTGSVGLGVAQTLFSSLVQDYIRAKDWRNSGGMEVRNPTPRAQRIPMASIFPPARSGLASRRRCFRRWCRITSARKTGRAGPAKAA